MCVVRQGGVLSPFLFAVYVDSLISTLRNSGSGVFIGNTFIGCMLYADDIVLISLTCNGLQRLVNYCYYYGKAWDIKFNPRKSQVSTFGGNCPQSFTIYMDDQPLCWVSKIKYLGCTIITRTGKVQVKEAVGRFYGSANNIFVCFRPQQK